MTIAPAAALDVEVDGDSYLVTGGVYHSSIYPYDRSEAAHCVNCFWKIVVICKSWSDDAHGSCPYLKLRCPATMRIAEVYRANESSRPPTTSTLWKWMGYTCLSQLPASTRVIEQEISSMWRVYVPQLVVTTNPPHTTLLHLTTHINLLNGLSMPVVQRDVDGNAVSIYATASRNITCQLACSYASAVTKFIQTGHVAVLLTLRWDGYYSVDGVPFSRIPGPAIVQQTSIPMTVIALKRHIVSNIRR